MANFGFEDLEVYLAARALKRRIYKLADLFPEEERYRLRLQMRKAALSITNCIAEGYGRFTYKDRVHFMREARGSLTELADDMNDVEDNQYAKPDHLDTLRADAKTLLKLLNGYIGYLHKQAQDRSPRADASGKKRSRPAPN